MENIERFFTGKYFIIPNYQRDYAWGEGNIDDLFEDIIESIETETPHYIGTFILSQEGKGYPYKVVDGQQRLTTITMVINATIEELGNDNLKIINRDRFICSSDDDQWRLELSNENNVFFHDILNSKSCSPSNKSQKLLLEAYKYIKKRVSVLSERENKFTVTDFLDCLKRLDCLEFVEQNDGRAIRIFQTVNDRGIMLSNMEKAKSLLIYYSNRFLKTKLDDRINKKFGDIFKIFNAIKEKAHDFSVGLLKDKTFNEDSVMRYHFLAFNSKYHHYKVGISEVLESFLKVHLKEIKTNETKLFGFIKDYVEDIWIFFKAFQRIINRVEKQSQYYKLLSIQDLSTNLYPLLIRLETKELLENQNDCRFLKLIETADIRVYKAKGRSPEKGLYDLAKDAVNLKANEIEDQLLQFIKKFMNINDFRSHLTQNVYDYYRGALKRVFIEYDEEISKSKYSVDDLIRIDRTEPTIEHIFPQQTSFDLSEYGFSDAENYSSEIHRIGNLLLLEKSVNKACQNLVPDTKIGTNGKYYEKSSHPNMKDFVARMRTRNGPFRCGDIDKRTKTLSEFIMGKWNI